jgi:hypothetical protein
MGKRSRNRSRTTRGHGPDSHRGRTTSSRSERPGAASAAEGVVLLAQAILAGEERVAEQLVDALGTGFPAEEIQTAASAGLVTAVTRLWEQGWQVADLVHSVGRKLPAPDRRLLLRTVVRSAEPWRHLASADPEWLAQLEAVEADLPRASRDGTVVTGWTSAERLHRFDALHRAATLLGLLWTVPPLERISPPPSAWGDTAARRPTAPVAGAGAGDEKILGRIRGLLAKAESTEFQPEAEALFAKAQELMTRYSIDHALLDGGDPAARGEQPIQRRLLIHDPYAKGKSALLAQVARANRCQSIWFAEAGFSSVVGFPTDLALTDLLFTSLVTQCSTAMQVASREVRQPRSFRESFTLAFAIRIGERLEAAAEAGVAEAVAERGDDLLPVLASRAEEVEEAFEAAFPRRRSSNFRVSDGRGWDAGRAAADVASISATRPAVPR